MDVVDEIYASDYIDHALGVAGDRASYVLADHHSLAKRHLAHPAVELFDIVRFSFVFLWRKLVELAGRYRLGEGHGIGQFVQQVAGERSARAAQAGKYDISTVAYGNGLVFHDLPFVCLVVFFTKQHNWAILLMLDPTFS
jgi:hypothetical protein